MGQLLSYCLSSHMFQCSEALSTQVLHSYSGGMGGQSDVGFWKRVGDGIGPNVLLAGQRHRAHVGR